MNYLNKNETAAERGRSPLKRGFGLGKKQASRRDGMQPVVADSTSAYVDSRSQSANQTAADVQRPAKKHYLLFGSVLVAISVAGILMQNTSTTVTVSDDATTAIESGRSNSLPIGARIASDDKGISMEPGDHTVEGTAEGSTTKLYVWDYAGEDGDYVQVLVDGEPISKEFMILHKPKEFDVPANCSVQIKGIHDAGGGLTYAAHYDLNGITYFNNAPEGQLNTYTIVGD